MSTLTVDFIISLDGYGAGEGWSDDGCPDAKLDLVESRTFDGNIQLLEYVPTVLDAQR
jgi:hypothetical protein